MILGFIIYVFLFALIVRQFYVNARDISGNKEAHRLAAVLVASICIKLLVVIIWYVNRGDNFDPVWDDTYKYDASGVYFANQFEQFVFINRRYIETLGAHPGFHILVGLIYSVYGHAPLMASAFNVLAVALFSILAYFIAFHIFGKDVARYTLIGNLFFPNYIPFEFFLLKDTFVTLGVVFIVWGIYKAAETQEIYRYLLPLPAIALLYFFRGELTIILLGALMLNEAYNCFGVGGSMRKTMTILVFLGFCLLAGNYLKPSERTALDRINEVSLGKSAYGGDQLPSFLEGATGVTDIVSRIVANPMGFAQYAAKSFFLVLIGPTYFYSQSGAELFYKYGRFIFWDNLTGFVKIIFAPMVMYGFIHIVKKYRKPAFIIYLFPALWFCCLLIVQDFFRWLLPALPFAIMIGAVGFANFHRIRFFYIPYLLAMLCFMVINATRQDSLAIGAGLTLVTLAGISLILLDKRWSS